VRNTDTGPLSAPVQTVQWTDINQDGKLDMLTVSNNVGQFWLGMVCISHPIECLVR